MRPDHRADRCQCKGRLPSTVTTGQIPRQHHRQNLQLSHQQLCHTGPDSHRPISTPLAGRAIFQVDQTAPENQIFFRNHRECGEESNLECDLGLRARGHHQKATQARNRTLHNSTDFKPDHFRENTIRSVAYEARLQNRPGRNG